MSNLQTIKNESATHMFKKVVWTEELQKLYFRKYFVGNFQGVSY